MTIVSEAMRTAVQGTSSCEEASRAVRQALMHFEVPAPDELVADIIDAHLGGDVVELGDDGLPTNALRRKWELTGS